LCFDFSTYFCRCQSPLQWGQIPSPSSRPGM
jgi:hypothetical protein